MYKQKFVSSIKCYDEHCALEVFLLLRVYSLFIPCKRIFYTLHSFVDCECLCKLFCKYKYNLYNFYKYVCNSRNYNYGYDMNIINYLEA